MAVAPPFDVSAINLLKLFLFAPRSGLVFLTSGRLASATEDALINTLEMPLVIACVWVYFAEMPTVPSFVGGIIVMMAVAGTCGRAIGRGSPPLPLDPAAS